MKHPLATTLCVVTSLSLLAPHAQCDPAAQDVGGTQSAKSFEATVSLKYLLYLPKGYAADPNQRWPLVLFLHGSGERGDDVQKVAIHGPPKLAAAGKDFPFVLVSPQCPPKQWWEPQQLGRLLDDVGRRYRIDPDRVYCTGLSMGGFGTWTMAAAHPDRFAAIAPICGGGDTFRAKHIKHIPTWVFHGEEDKAVPIRLSEQMVAAMKEAGAPEVKFTRYAGVGHDSWTKAYDDAQLYEWLLSKRRSDRAAATTRPVR